MAGSFSQYLENKLLDHVFGKTTYTAPATVYVGLWTAALSRTSTGSTAGEVSGGDYARVAVTNDGTNFPAASGGAKSNGAEVTFPEASGSWGTVTHIAILDADTAGDILAWATLVEPKTVGSGDTPSFAVGDLDLSLT